MCADAVLPIKQSDALGPRADADANDDEPCTVSFHSAFAEPLAQEDAPDRWSIEVRRAMPY